MPLVLLSAYRIESVTFWGIGMFLTNCANTRWAPSLSSYRMRNENCDGKSDEIKPLNHVIPIIITATKIKQENLFFHSKEIQSYFAYSDFFSFSFFFLQNASTFYGDKWAHSLLQTTGTATNKDYINHVNFISYIFYCIKNFPFKAVINIKIYITSFLQWAVLRTSEGAFYGIKASLSTHDLPTVKQDQSSAMEIWFVNEGDGSDEDYNAIQVGWQVSLTLFFWWKEAFWLDDQ